MNYKGIIQLGLSLSIIRILIGVTFAYSNTLSGIAADIFTVLAKLIIIMLTGLLYWYVCIIKKQRISKYYFVILITVTTYSIFLYFFPVTHKNTTTYNDYFLNNFLINSPFIAQFIVEIILSISLIKNKAVAPSRSNIQLVGIAYVILICTYTFVPFLFAIVPIPGVIKLQSILYLAVPIAMTKLYWDELKQIAISKKGE